MEDLISIEEASIIQYRYTGTRIGTLARHYIALMKLADEKGLLTEIPDNAEVHLNNGSLSVPPKGDAGTS